MPMRMEDEAGQ
jgi:hypothetical protein